MPQLFQVLKCFKCSFFQVHQTKKSNKWECKLCAEKQSIKRHYGIGTAKECRLHVQKLNGIRGEIDEASETAHLNKSSDDETEIPVTIKKSIRKPYKNSKWSNFIDEEADVKQNAEESMYLGNTEVVLDIPTKKMKKFKPPKVAVEEQSNASATITTMSLDYEPVEPVFTQTESTEPAEYDNSFFKSRKYEHQTKISKPIAPLFGQAKQNIIVNSNKHKISIQPNINSSVQNSKELIPNEIPTYYVPPKVNKSSKWAEYAENDDKNFESIDAEFILQNTLLNQETIDQAQSQNNILNGQEIIHNVSFSINDVSENISSSQQKSSNNNTMQLFTLCDESELDDVLDF